MSRLRRILESILHLQDTPHRIALSFGIGVWIAFFPIFGIHTGMALAIAFLFRLPRVPILVGAYINNPWTLGPLYVAGTFVGCVLLGVPVDGLEAIEWSAEGGEFRATLTEALRAYLWPYVVGNTVLGIAGGLAGYVLLRRFIERRQALRTAPPPTPVPTA